MSRRIRRLLVAAGVTLALIAGAASPASAHHDDANTVWIAGLAVYSQQIPCGWTYACQVSYAYGWGDGQRWANDGIFWGWGPTSETTGVVATCIQFVFNPNCTVTDNPITLRVNLWWRPNHTSNAWELRCWQIGASWGSMTLHWHDDPGCDQSTDWRGLHLGLYHLELAGTIYQGSAGTGSMAGPFDINSPERTAIDGEMY